MKKEKYNITGMSCSACSARVEKAVGKLQGIAGVTVNLLTNSMQVQYDESKLQSAMIVSAVEKAGYGASLPVANESASCSISSLLKAFPEGLFGEHRNISFVLASHASRSFRTGRENPSPRRTPLSSMSLIWALTLYIP